MSEAKMLLGNRYEIGRLLGRGGMAEVYLAHDTRLNRRVAVKVLRSDLARDDHFHERFRREAQAAASLNHPAIVGVYDTGEDHRTETSGSEVTIPYIVMEYVEGETLRHFFSEEKPMNERQASEIMAGVLGALEYSHQAGIVHRDIKPGNIMITKNNEVKVMDFGIARAVAESSGNMTQTSAVMGTAQYLSPEQARGQQVDSRSDVYSAAVVLYEMLTGRPPFTGDSAVSIAYQHVRELPPAPSTYNPGISPNMDAVVLHGLVKDRDARYQSAADFARDIAAIAAGKEPAIINSAAFVDPDATQLISPTGDMTQVLDPQQTQIIPATAPTQVVSPVAASTATDPVALASPGSEVATEEEEKKGKALAWILASIAVLAVLALAGWWFLSQQDRTPQTVAVPQIVGTLEAEAKALLENAGLNGRFAHEANAEIPAGTVISADPNEGTEVETGSTVNVVVSSGPGDVSVPDLADLTVDEATSVLEQLGLSLQVVGTEDSELEKDRIVRSEPGPNSAAKEGDQIRVWLSTGETAVPQVLNLQEADASRLIEEAGFTVVLSNRPAADGEVVGTVVDQSPGAGETLKQGGTVTLVIASQVVISMPNVTGWTLADAQAQMASAGLGTQIEQEFSDTVPEGSVIRTNPEANTDVDPGSTITIVVSRGPEEAPAETNPPADNNSGNGNGSGNGGN